MDNRLLLDPTGQNHGLARALYWNLQFYTPPIELEVVEGHDALGFNIDPLQQTITVLQPRDKQFPSTRFARIRLICQHVSPRELQIAQLQGLTALYCTRDSGFLQHKSKIYRVVASLRPEISMSTLFAYAYD